MFDGNAYFPMLINVWAWIVCSVILVWLFVGLSVCICISVCLKIFEGETSDKLNKFLIRTSTQQDFLCVRPHKIFLLPRLFQDRPCFGMTSANKVQSVCTSFATRFHAVHTFVTLEYVLDLTKFVQNTYTEMYIISIQ